MRTGPVRFWERPLARFRPAPRHDPPLKPRRARLRFLKAAFTAVLKPLSVLCGFVLLLLGRRRHLDPAKIKRIAFIKLDHIGDAVMATPHLRALRAWAPEAEIIVFARPQSAEMLERLHSVSEVEEADIPWIRPDSSSMANLKACFALVRRIRTLRCDLAVDLRYHNRLDSLLLSLCGARAKLGYDVGGFGFGVTHRAVMPRKGHEVERGAAALRKFGIPVNDLSTEFPMQAAAEEHMAAVLKAGTPVVAVHPGAGNAIKRWMPERFAEVARELAKEGKVRIALLAGPGEETLGEPVARAVPAHSLIDLRGKLSLLEMAGIMANCDLFVGNDGGPAHVSAALGVPTLVVFSGTSVAADWAPRGRTVRIIEKWVPCKPCHSTACPYSVACLRAVEVGEVKEAAEGMIGRRLSG